MSDAGPFVAWLAFAWFLFVVGNSLSGLVDAWAALARVDGDCDVDDCEVFRCEACDRHAHSVGTPANWAFDPEDSVYLCGDCQDDHDEPHAGAT